MAVYGFTVLLVEMGPLKCVLAVVWINDRRMVLGCIDGTIYDARLASRLTRADDKIRISLLYHPSPLAIYALAYDVDRNLLAVGYSKSVVVWEKGIGKRGQEEWETIHSLDLSAALPTGARTHTLRFMGSEPGRLIVGTEAGAWNWIFEHREQLISLSDLTKVYDIGAIAFALDDSLMAVSTLEHTVLIWPITPTFEVLSILSRQYTPESGQEWRLWQPHVPIAITDERRVVVGTLDGTIAVLTCNGFRLQSLKRAAHCTRAIVTDRDMLYVAYTVPVGVVIIVGYTNDRATNLKEYNPSHPAASRQTIAYDLCEVLDEPAPKMRPSIYLVSSSLTFAWFH
ncbi:hypothetical protein FRC07_002971 [Ceratobasidium sp. 392]|nr:hypothetical protein FRC07_002971 [Ceratobasidium sp. 392]